MSSPYADDFTFQDPNRYYDAMTNAAMYHNPHTPGAESQKEKLKSGWKCMLSFRIFQLFPSNKTGFYMTVWGILRWKAKKQ